MKFSKASITAFGVGVLFALGLGIAGMTPPDKITGFLDVGGAWQADLLFVMLGAISVTMIGYRITMKRDLPAFDRSFHLPTNRTIDARLLLGAAVFGVGWGLGGYCPGPALTSLVTFEPAVWLFVICMLLGMNLGTRFN